MKTISAFLGATLLAGGATAASADTIVFDQTQDVSYHGNSPYNYFGGSSIGDHIGTGFDTEKVAIGFSGDSITLKFYTQFAGNDLGAHYADVFLAPAGGSSTPSSYGLGISLGFQGSNGGAAQGFYSLGSGDSLTSQDIWGSRTGFIYGGEYIAPGDVTGNPAQSVVTGGNQLGGWNVAVSSQASGEPSYPVELDVTLTAPNLAAFFATFDMSMLDIFWATGDCNNDGIFAQVDVPTRVPEPSTFFLFGGMLLALTYLVRRRAVSLG
jgi:hypothetical protein